MKNHSILTLLALSGALLAPQIASASTAKAQNVVVTIDGRGFHPGVLNVKAGKPVHLTFISKEGSCASDFTIPTLKRTVSLKPGQRRKITFTPKKGQTIAFACSMNMFKGKVTAK
jgi:plastocyanin domain-containing protein